MKTIVIISAFLLMGKMLTAQDTIMRFEFGSTLLTVNPSSTTRYFAQDRSTFEILNGLFFRYNKKRFGLRLLASYSENYSTFSSPPEWSDGVSGDNYNKDIRIGIGGQYSIMKRRDWFYTFLDASYRNRYSYGSNYGGIRGANEKISSTTNGLDLWLGLGFRIKVIRNFYLSPELGYLGAYGYVNSTTTEIPTGKQVKGNYTNFNLTTAMRIHLTVKFN